MFGSAVDNPELFELAVHSYLHGGPANFTGQPITLPDGETYTIVEWDDDELEGVA